MTDKNTDYSNLKEKTIFDFCKDAEMRKEIIGGDFTEPYYKSFPETVILEHLVKYAALIHNKELWDIAKAQLDIAYKQYERKKKEAMSHGLLID